VTIFWKAATDNAGVVEYDLRYGSTPELGNVRAFDGNTLEATFADPVGSKLYYQLVAVDEAGNFSQSSVYSIGLTA
ncbi:MAG: hypothetical protein PHS41_01815, partial [Victivallaceae bacterium]|nr:hypothetical protein [Victivallaceae bacterium]